MKNKGQIQKKIKSVILEIIKNDIENIELEKNGKLDSFFALLVISAIEQEFSCNIDLNPQSSSLI